MMPTKQHGISIPLSSSDDSAVGSCYGGGIGDVDLVGDGFGHGKVVSEASRPVEHCEGLRSKTARPVRPVRPCSRRALAYWRARVPAPPVIVHVVHRPVEGLRNKLRG